MAKANQPEPTDIDVRGQGFSREMLRWSLQARSETHQLIAGSNEAIATSNALMADADRILARR